MILEVDNIHKSYGKNTVLRGTSFNVRKGEIKALVGPNGSGKTTLLDIITNLKKADSGYIRIFNKENTDNSIFKKLSFLKDNSILYDYLTPRDHLEYICQTQKINKKKIIETANLLGINRHPSYLDKKVSSLSLGMKQHLLIALSIINNPELLILDEPLNGLDPTSVIEFRNLILKLNKEGTTIIISSHNLLEIDKITNDIMFLYNGSIIKEDLSLLSKRIYRYSFDKKYKNKIYECLKIKLDNNNSFESNKPLSDTIDLLYRYNIQIKDIDKRKVGAEERYSSLFVGN